MNVFKYCRWALAPALGLLFAVPASATHSNQAEAEPSPTLNLIGQFDVPFDGLTSDVWALGNYAYLGSFSEPLCSFDITGTRIIDISNPSDPTQVAFIKDKQGTRTNDVKAFSIATSKWTGDILVTTNEGCGFSLPRLNSQGGKPRPGRGGINIYDVSDPTKPHALKQNFLPKANGIHNTYVWEDGGGNAYLIAVDDIDARDVIIVDITNPASPNVVTRTGAPDWPGLDFSEIEGPAVFLHDVWVQDGIAYLSYWDAGLVLLDVADPANPVFLGDSTYPNPDASGLPPEGNGHVAVPNAAGDLVIFGDEDTARESGFLDSTIGGVPQTNKIGFADFGPSALDSFPTAVTAVAANLGCSSSDFGTGAVTDVVLIERGACFFSQKAENAEAAGYGGYIVFNSVAGGEGLINMASGTAGPWNIPGIFVTRSLGSAMAAELGIPGVVTADNVAGIADGEGFMRVYDVTDPANMVEVGRYYTERTLPPLNLDALGGTRDAHNVVVDGTTAYWAWYNEGIRVVDFSDCQAGDGFLGCTPTEVAHWGGGPDPIADFWGVYLHTLPDGNTYILGSDRSIDAANGLVGGLKIFATP
ncbi:MAG: hypothetical protein OES26_20320 [Gammaproteobacteria bacterium]|nr:hypothetical protein [Gammaproteobacteria bacterium]